jgi:hypothetical protein
MIRIRTVARDGHLAFHCQTVEALASPASNPNEGGAADSGENNQTLWKDADPDIPILKSQGGVREAAVMRAAIFS